MMKLKGLWKNKNTGTIYRSVDVNGTGIAEVTNWDSTSKYLVKEDSLIPHEVAPNEHKED